MNFSRQTGLFIVAAGTLALAGCGKNPAPAPAPKSAPAPAAVAAPAVSVSVSSVQLGNALDADGMVSSNGLTFAPNDTIYAVVLTNSAGKANATITAQWTYGDQDTLVNKSDQKIASDGMMTTTFHISKPSGFPAGDYTLRVSVNGKVESTINFDVQ